jgi:hypothetical protein
LRTGALRLRFGIAVLDELLLPYAVGTQSVGRTTSHHASAIRGAQRCGCLESPSAIATGIVLQPRFQACQVLLRRFQVEVLAIESVAPDPNACGWQAREKHVCLDDADEGLSQGELGIHVFAVVDSTPSIRCSFDRVSGLGMLGRLNATLAKLHPGASEPATSGLRKSIRKPRTSCPLQACLGHVVTFSSVFELPSCSIASSREDRQVSTFRCTS